MNKETLFDLNIANKISQIQLNIPDQPWEEFNDYMNKTNLEKALRFDVAVSESVTAYPILDHSKEWDSFKEKLDSLNNEVGDDFDNAIRARVANASNHLFMSPFDLSSKKMASLKFTKLAEVAVILLLFFISWNVIPELNNAYSFEQITNQKNTSEKENLTTNPGAQDFVASTDENFRKPNTDRVLGQTTTATALTFKLQKKAYANTKNSSSIFSEKWQSDIGNVSIAHPFSLDPSLNLSYSINNKEDIKELKNGKSFLSDLQELRILNIFPETQQVSHATAVLNHAFKAPTFRMHESFISRILVGIKIGPVIDKIITPISEYGMKDIISREVNNSLIGFDIELDNKWVNVEAGVSYSFKKYGYRDINDAKGHFISIPLSLKKTFFKDKILSPYIKVGPDFTIVLASEARPESVNRNLINSLDQYAPSADYISKSKVEEGVFTSGSVADNSYFGVHTGIGVELKLKKQVALTLEATQQFNPFQKELGINNEKFSQTTFAFGFKKLIHFNNGF